MSTEWSNPAERPCGTTVLVADDHPVFRDGLIGALNAASDLAVVGHAECGAQTLAALSELTPDVAVVDLQLPDMDGIEVIRRAGKAGLDSLFVIVSAFDDTSTVYWAIEAGARAYLPKVLPADELCSAVRAVARGEAVIPAALQTALASEIRDRQQRSNAVLTLRETEILALTAEGLSAPAIAERLFLGVTTVKSHLQHVYVKLEVSDRAAAVARAHRLGLLS